MESRRVRDAMTSEVTTLRRNETLTLADDLMQLGRIRYVPVLDDEGQEVFGIVTQRDLFRGGLALALGYTPRELGLLTAAISTRIGAQTRRPLAIVIG